MRDSQIVPISVAEFDIPSYKKEVLRAPKTDKEEIFEWDQWNSNRSYRRESW